MPRPDQTPLPCIQFNPMEWHLLKIEVGISRKAIATFDGTFAGAFHPYFTTKGSGGIVVANGFENVGNFREFNIAPKLAKQQSGQSGKISECNLVTTDNWHNPVITTRLTNNNTS